MLNNNCYSSYFLLNSFFHHISQRVKTCRDQLNEHRYRNSTAAAAHQVCESTTAYRMETGSMRYRVAVQAWSIATSKTCLRLGQLLRFQAGSRHFLAVVHKPHLCLPVRRLSHQGPSTFQPLRLLLRPAEQYGYRYPQMCRPRPTSDVEWRKQNFLACRW